MRPCEGTGLASLPYYLTDLPHSPDSNIIVIGLYCSSPSSAEPAETIQQPLRCCNSSRPMHVCGQSVKIRWTCGCSLLQADRDQSLTWPEPLPSNDRLIPPHGRAAVWSGHRSGTVWETFLLWGSVVISRLQREILHNSTEHVGFSIKRYTWLMTLAPINRLEFLLCKKNKTILLGDLLHGFQSCAFQNSEQRNKPLPAWHVLSIYQYIAVVNP